MSVIVLIPAAGLGRRMGAEINKQYLTLDKLPILTHTIAVFDNHPLVDHIYVIAPENQLELCQGECITPYGFTKVRDIVIGGEQRQDSVRNGLLACGGESDDVVIIHDGVRPLFQPEQIAMVVAAVHKSAACVVGVPVKDTIKQVADGRIVATPARASLWAAQTPQAFRYELILAAHMAAHQQHYVGTDDASLLEWQGLPVVMLNGSYSNIKITTAEDMLFATAIMHSRG
jgi:2-C-methyl-D-erythritol 4-phosphate cytidylyltransferase